MHVLIEKPLSTTFDGIDELKRAAATKKRLVGVAYTWRSWPSFAAMRDAIKAGRFGQPLQVVVTGGQHFPHFRPAYREIYYKDRKTGGGAIQDGLTHLINAVEWVVGPTDRLFADAAHLALPGVTVEDHVHLITRHGGVMGSFTFSQHQAPNEISITVVCERGTAKFESWNNRWRWMTGPTDAWHDEEGGKMERDDLYVTQAHAFLDAVEGKRPLLCTLEEAEQTLRVNLAALKCADNPPWEKVR
jgi:predicted dehydrogenase